MKLKAPFPWFGGKSRVAHIVWDRFGNVVNYVEPFAGSLAVLLGRPPDAKNETVNDKDAYISNFWRALQADPELVAKYADWPVNETDLHARHKWLVNRSKFKERMLADPHYYDAKVAGWWVWGISMWIGGGWCRRPDWSGRGNATRASRGIFRTEYRRPNLTNNGVHRTIYKRPAIGKGGHGIHAQSFQLPDISGNSGSSGRGIFQKTIRKMPDVSGAHGCSGKGIFTERASNIYNYFGELRDRLRNVRICCGEWSRILGPSPTTSIGTTAVFLDPPYSADRDDVYNEDTKLISRDVREWAVENGNNQKLRIAVCGYEGEHQFPASWACVAWKANGGYGNQARLQTRGRDNCYRERIWFSPHCLHPDLFN